MRCPIKKIQWKMKLGWNQIKKLKSKDCIFVSKKRGNDYCHLMIISWPWKSCTLMYLLEFQVLINQFVERIWNNACKITKLTHIHPAVKKRKASFLEFLWTFPPQINSNVWSLKWLLCCYYHLQIIKKASPLFKVLFKFQKQEIVRQSKIWWGGLKFIKKIVILLVHC